MIIVQIKTKDSAQAEALKKCLEVMLNQENATIYEGDEYVIMKKIPIFSPEELTKHFRPKNKTNKVSYKGE